VSAPFFLVERYLPAIDAASLAALGARFAATTAAMRGEGRAVAWIHSVFVAEDESCLCLFCAETLELVEEANRRAGVPFDRIVGAIAAGEL
jgi:hypothetical protein